MNRTVLAMAAVAIAAGCAGEQTPHLLAAGGARSYPPGFTVELPPDWIRVESKEGLRATRDGFRMQDLRVAAAPAYPPRARWPGLKGGLPEEWAEQLVAQLDSRLRDPHVLEIRPATLSGAAGYRCRYSWRSESGLRYLGEQITAVVGETAWSIGYTAPARHYYELDLPVFERAVATFRLAPATAR